MICKHLPVCLLLLLGLGFGANVSATSQCSGGVEPPDCVSVDNSGAVDEDYRVTNTCPHPVTLWFDLPDDGDDWVVEETFTTTYGYLNVQPDSTGASGIRYDTELDYVCCPNIDGVSCSGEESSESAG